MIGAPFYVMERVDGHAVPHRRPARAARRRARPGDHRRRRWSTCSPRCTRSTRRGRARPTSAGPRASSSGRCGAGASSSTARAAATLPASTSCTPRSAATLPAGAALRRSCTATTGSTTCSIDAERPDRVAAVLDWEMATLGDPLTDVGLLLVYWRVPGSCEHAAHAGRPTRRPPGLPRPATRCSSGTPPARRATSGRSRFYLGARLLQARRDPRGHPLPLHAGPDGRRGFDRDRRRWSPLDRRRPAPLDQEG